MRKNRVILSIERKVAKTRRNKFYPFKKNIKLCAFVSLCSILFSQLHSAFL